MKRPQLENYKNQRDTTEVYKAVYNIIPKNDYLPSFPTQGKKWVISYITMIRTQNQQGLLASKTQILVHKILNTKPLES